MKNEYIQIPLGLIIPLILMLTSFTSIGINFENNSDYFSDNVTKLYFYKRK